ncbi:MAG TPA: PKD domain-containing protein, partial [Chitinophagaceae bacterium]|nr:PKD domain-containing protein [Chitinophagaceae bacterium]
TYLWEFGDPGNQTSAAAQPSFKYPAFGTYTVKLTVSNKSGCASTFTKQVTLVNELADFTVSKPSVCNNETFTLSAITSNAANVSQYIWSINGGAPVVAGRNYQTSLPANGTYNVTLTILDKYGCPDTKTKNGVVTVTGPTANFSSSISGACRNAIATFTDASIPAGGINRWTFNYGDGSVQSYTAPPFTHQYKDTGSFAVQLTVQDATGCTSTFTLPTPVKISRPVVGFTVQNTLSCPGLPFQFTDTSRTYGKASYLWNFGDGGTSTLQNPVHVYAAGNRTYRVSLTVQDSLGCSDSLSKANYITVRSPKAAFQAKDTVSICLPLETTFYNKSENYESLYWDFGDGNTSSLDTTSNFYNTFGTFKAKLLAIGTGGCKDSSEVTVNVYNPSSGTTIDYRTVVECNSARVDFAITRPPLTSYTFYFGDGATNNSGQDTIQHVYGSPNAYFPSIYIGDSIGCLAAVGGAKPVVILGANPFFSTDKTAFCDSGTVFFTNFTLGNDPVISSVWDFGDGNTSTDKDVIHNYTTPGQYIASLNINTQNGCAKTLTDTINIYATPAPSINSDSLSCINSAIQFNGELAFPDSLVKWNWNLGNGQTSTAKNPSVVYDKEGPYTITLEATNVLGCKASTTKTIFVKPLPVITVLQEPVIPVGSGITLPVSYSPGVQGYQWTPATGLTCTTCPNPIANPTINTTYKVAVRDSLGCLSSKDLTVRVVCNEKNYFVPNTFTPNGDGVNDFFYPRGNNINRVQSMRIFNRWGEMIFEKRNFAANSQADGWNGTYKGKAAASDAYVYLVEFICENGSIIPFKGNVTLVR